ncbi:hypothetical protein V5O48_001763 [Marasmius crinis-equi]|uniref:rRNA-processing protein FYV7 n=1 Tax=Marasmius crinis-equi TaxID=585013 RepID=A0ABR3FXJ7_9AGAR
MPPSRREKKKPPTFTHLPAARAKALKQAWVEKAKIKSKWKAERRKMGLAPAAQVNDLNEDDGVSGDAVGEEVSQEEEHVIQPDVHKDDTPPVPIEEKSRFAARKRNKTSSAVRAVEESQSRVRDAQKPKDNASQSVDLRELARKAYSRESLHTYKSDPLKRRPREEHAKKGGGRGQPNMKLRMNVMLEKIKRDYA